MLAGPALPHLRHHDVQAQAVARRQLALRRAHDPRVRRNQRRQSQQAVVSQARVCQRGIECHLLRASLARARNKVDVPSALRLLQCAGQIVHLHAFLASVDGSRSCCAPCDTPALG